MPDVSSCFFTYVFRPFGKRYSIAIDQVSSIVLLGCAASIGANPS